MSSKVLRGGVTAEPIQWRHAGAPATSIPPIVSSPDGAATGNAQQLAARIRELEAELQSSVAAAHSRGRKEGEAATRQQLEAQVSALLQQLSRSIDEITGMRSRLRHEAEQDIISLALAIARRILHRELTLAPDALLGLLKAALEKIDARELHGVRVHPENAPMLRQHLENVGLPRKIEVIGDTALERGAVVLETGKGVLDASVETQLVEIERGFADLVRRAS